MDQPRPNGIAKPPWAGQSVRPWVRVLAWTFVLLAVLSGVGAALLTRREGGVPFENLPLFLLFVIGEIYFVVLLGHVGIKGVAPSSWLPWR
ncbi:MAG: hypothetical protein R3245_05460 [Kiloniellales bacterium]|nr:hypothetical protein [Kiloniellales bacterium]